MARNRFDRFGNEMAWIDNLGPPNRSVEEMAHDVAFRRRTLHMREHLYRIREVMSHEQYMRFQGNDAEKMLKDKMAYSIGQVILSRVAEFEKMDMHMERQICFSASFYAIPPRMVNGDVEFADNMQMPRAVQETTREVIKRVEIKTQVLPVEYATDELVEVWQIAYDMAMASEGDDVPPEKRALDAVLDYMREKITPV